MASQNQPLDEINWSNPRFVQTVGIHENSVLHYFAESPFFDLTSNNAVINSQSQFNPAMAASMGTRQLYEGRLKTMSGLEFMIAQEPAEMAPGMGTGVWVIRKQTRRKRQPPEEDEITVHSTYFVCGDNIYMAPTAADVIASRFLSITDSLNKCITQASDLPLFSPALGRTYFPALPSRSTRNPESQLTLTQGSKESTPLPESLPLPNASTAKKPINTQNSSYLSHRLLEETINITLKYGDEYMDENPITGAPGEFHLSSTGRKVAEKLLVPPTAMTMAAKGGGLGAGKQPTPLNTKDLPAQKKGDKGGKSPRTPGSGKVKRRKSKVAGAGGVSPTT